MKKFFYIFLFVFGIVNYINAQSNTSRIMTYNIRYANNNIGEEWDLRKENVCEMIRFHKPDIFGLQEALLEQVEYISDEFEEFKMIGVGRDDGLKEGEFSPLFISKIFEVMDSGTFWLSETPDTPSLGWDASYKRIATWTKIHNRNSNDSLFIINTHFDHRGDSARVESAKLLIERISGYSRNLPIVLMGDFNITDDAEAYKIINNSHLLEDSNKKSQNHYGTNNTFNGFGNEALLQAKIDYIFVSDSVDVIHHAIIGDKFNNKYPSDHMPVIIDISISK